jgi:SOS-response transcriptional repressor LexA
MNAEDREKQVLEAIDRGQKTRGYAPTRRELAAEIGISTTRVQQLVDSCTSKGYLRRVPRAARAYGIQKQHAEGTR